jgi:hypothetical protein
MSALDQPANATGPRSEERTPLGAYARTMFFWAVVSDEIDRVIKFFSTRWEAEDMLNRVLWVEPSWGGILRVERVELRTGGPN